MVEILVCNGLVPYKLLHTIFYNAMLKMMTAMCIFAERGDMFVDKTNL